MMSEVHKLRHSTGVSVFGLPGRGQEVEDTVEDIVQVCVALINQQHHGITAG